MTRFYDYDNWYVYEIVDPRTETAFYIGKTATLNARFTSHKKDTTSAAHPRLTEIRLAGFEGQMRPIAAFRTEREALDYETYLIQRTPGLVNRMGYFSPTKPFRRPVTNPDGDHIEYVSEESDENDYERRVSRVHQIIGGGVSEESVRRVLEALESLFHEDGEYTAFTDE